MKGTEIEKIRDKVLEEWFGTSDQKFLEKLSQIVGEIDVIDLENCIEIAIEMTENYLKKKKKK